MFLSTKIKIALVFTLMFKQKIQCFFFLKNLRIFENCEWKHTIFRPSKYGVLGFLAIFTPGIRCQVSSHLVVVVVVVVVDNLLPSPISSLCIIET